MSGSNGHQFATRVDQQDVIAALFHERRNAGDGPVVILEELRGINQTQLSPPLPDDVLSSVVAAGLKAEGDAAAVKHALAAATEQPIPLTDQGNAERLALAHSGQLRYVPGIGWFNWDGTRFKRDTDGGVMRRMVLTVRAIYAEAAREPDDDKRKAISKHATASEAEPRLRRAITLAQSLQAFILAPDELDADPYALNTRNGIVNLRHGTRTPHDPARLCSKITNADYDASAVHPVFERFLAETTGADAELEGFLRRAAGATLAGVVVDQVLLFLHGPGATGKSTLLAALKAALGEYAVTTDFETFLARRDTGGARSDLARLHGARMVISSEVDDGRRLAEAALKQLTGGDTITARFMYADYFEFTPRFTLWLAANRRPTVDANDDAMWRRILQVPFTRVVPPGKRDPNVLRALAEDPDAQAAVLAWAVRGCLEWQEQGLAIPASVRAYTEEYRQENDPVALWLTDECELTPHASERASALRASYEAWAQTNGERPIGPRKFAAALRGHDLRDGKGTGGVRVWHGVALSGATNAISENLPCARTHRGVTESGATSATHATPGAQAA